MTGSLLIIAALGQLITGAPPLAQAVPATDWSCAFEAADGARLKLTGRIAEIPAGTDPNSSLPTEAQAEGLDTLAGKYGVTSQHASDWFREYQLSAFRKGGERYNVNLKLRRGGAGVADITRYVENSNREPYSYFAAGLCTSQFDVAGAPQGKKP